MKGIVLAGGAGTRLYPITAGISKQLLPVYDKPMLYYPLSVLMLAGIRDILIITTPADQPVFMKVFGDGSRFGINLQYAVQPEPKGLAQAFIIAEEFIGKEPVCLILGDNIFHGPGFSSILKNVIFKYNMTELSKEQRAQQATIFGYYVNDPQRYGIIDFDKYNNILSIEEKPVNPKSNYAIPGLYFYPDDVSDMAKLVKPSSRGELEITDLNNLYLRENRLEAKLLPRGFAWLDTGTFDSLSEASSYVETIEKRTNKQIACLEEIGYQNGWLTEHDIRLHMNSYGNNQYRDYILEMIKR